MSLRAGLVLRMKSDSIMRRSRLLLHDLRIEKLLSDMSEWQVCVCRRIYEKEGVETGLAVRRLIP